MQQVKQKYTYNQINVVATTYQDNHIKSTSYRGKRNQDHQPVLINVYRTNKIAQVANYYKRITKIAQIKHQNLTPILDCIMDASSNELVVVFEWNEGFCLKEYLKKELLSWQTAFNIIKDVSKGLKCLHDAGLLHSFVNLQNIEIFNGRGRLSYRYLIYKTYYLAPEIKENHTKTKESDFFSLGVCFYKLIFGQFPFKSQNQEEFISKVKLGLSRKVYIPNNLFPIAIPSKMHVLFNTLCNFAPEARTQTYTIIQSLQVKKKKIWQQDVIREALGSEYLLLDIEQQSQELMRTSVIKYTKQKDKQPRLYHMEIIAHNLTEISTYIDEILLPFRLTANPSYANIAKFYVVLKKHLVVIYEYCSQASLLSFKKTFSLDDGMIDEVNDMLKRLLSQWKGQYRFLSNEQVLIKNGKPVLKYPPYPTQLLKDMIDEAKNGKSFIAPEVGYGVQSSSADSWSAAVLQYWMRLGSMPQFDENGQLIILNKNEISVQKIKELNERIKKRPRERKNQFPPQLKKSDLKNTNDSMSSSEGPRSQLSHRIKSHSLGPNNLVIIPIGQEQLDDFNQIDEFQIYSPKKDEGGARNDIKKRRQTIGGDQNNRVQREQQRKQTEDQIRLILEGTNSEINDIIHEDDKQKGNRNKKEQEKNGLITKDSKPKVPRKRDSQKMKQEEIKRKQQVKRKRFPTFSGEVDKRQKTGQQKQGIQVNSNKKSKHQLQKQQKMKRRQSMQSNMAIEQMNLKDKLFSHLVKQASKLAIVEKHWTKPIRIVIKCIIALLLYIFVFYLSFLSINANLIKTRYEYKTQTLSLRSNEMTLVSTINFTIVTKNHNEASVYNNSTLSMVRDTLRCVTNDYGSNSDVLEVINSLSFVVYQAFGIIIVIVNLMVVAFALSKLDFAKAITLTGFDDHFYVPIYSWLLVNLAISSLTSFTYLIYGGLFTLQLEPCISRANHSSLIFILKKLLSSFSWRFTWIYIGVIIAYAVIIFLTIKPTYRLHRYLYTMLVFLYLGGIGARALGTFSSSWQGVIGICGQLMTLLIGIPLLLMDLLITCKMRGIKTIKMPLEQHETEYNVSNENIKSRR